jgi:hypothetical protein
LAAFRRYVVFLDKWTEVETALKTAKLVTVTSSEHVQNMERRGQWMMLAVMLDKRLTEIEDRFGMNPAARQRLMLQMAQQGALPITGGGRRDDQGAGAGRGDGQGEDLPHGPTVEHVDVPESPIGLLN